MLTAYGKLIRKHRIDQGMTLRAMASALGITPAFLSATETGRKPVPTEMLNKITKLLQLNREECDALKRAAESSRADFTVRLGKHVKGNDREVAAMFARKFRELSETEKEAIRMILARRNT